MYERLIELEELKVEFAQVIKLAKDYRVYDEQHSVKEATHEEELVFENSPEGKELKRRRKELREYLEGLDFEAVKAIQVVMYIAIEESHNETDRPKKIYGEKRESYDSLGWEKNRFVIGRLTENIIALEKDLENGLEILDVQL
ncbi:hypothetical protein [Bacillus paranthracis]|uniref:hypothetical protein n=1 Tax=Bacillus paranthracis TaxID=2026186 RepID=UPI0020B869A1|nr:hypothetical protein MON10_08345 [Bacillus paranthracis]